MQCMFVQSPRNDPFQVTGTCVLFTDYITGQCTTQCLDPQQCSMSTPPCTFRPIRTAEDFAHYENCTEAGALLGWLSLSDCRCAVLC